MKVKFTKLAALLLSGAALLAAGCTDYEVDIQKNADAIASANDQIKALQSTIATLETAAQHQADVDKLNKAISDLQALMEKDYATKQALNEAVQKLEGVDAGFKAQIEDLTKNKADKAYVDAAIQELVDGEIANLKGQVATIQETVDNLTKEGGVIDQINAKITDLQQNKVDKADFEETKKMLSKAIEDLQKLTAGFPADQTIKEYVDAMDVSLKSFVQEELKKYATKAELEQVKNTLSGRLDSVEGMLKGFKGEGAVKAYIDGEVSKLNDAIGKINEAIENIEDRLDAAEKTLEQVKSDLLAVKAAIRSLVFVPEVYVDGVEAILVSTLNYNALTLNDADSEKEKAVADTTLSTLTPAVIAKYHVIPSNADLSFLEVGDSVKFVIRENDPFKTIRTRAEATDDFDVVGIYQGRDSVETDVIRVEVKVTGKPATEELISVVALQLTKDEETYTSDYATVFSEDIDDLRIANSTLKEEPAHYRRATEGIATADAEAAIADIPAWTAEFDTLSVDHQMAYDEEFDLNEYVVAHFLGEDECNGEDAATFNALGLTWKFELVKNYEVGNSEMFTLKDGVLTAKDANAINLTPIVRVYLKDGENNVQIAYVKVWVAPSAKDTKITWSLNDPFDVKDQFEFKCEGDTLYADSTVIKAKIQKNGEEVVLKDISWKNFVAAYPEFVDAVDPKVDTMGTVKFENDSLKWVMTPEELWAVASDPNLKEGEIPVVKHNVAFEAINGEQVVVELVADVKPVAAYKIPVERYIPNYWNENLTAAQYNVATPDLGETDSTKCVFHNNINAAFLTDETGVIDLGERKLKDGTVLPAVGEPGLEVSNINYFFCPDIEKVTKVGKYDVKFEVKNDSTELWAAIGSEESVLIATIDNASTEKELTPNIVILNKVSEDPNHAAKRLLNTDEFFIYLGATGLVCGDEGFEVNLYWPDAEGKYLDHFQADYIQPVKVTDTANDYFVDAVDFGQDGSFITLKDLVAPKDWRGRVFGMNEGDQYYNYWDYYGIFKISVDINAITCDLTPDETVPVTLVLKAMSKDELLESVNTEEPLRDADGNVVKDEEGNVVTVGDYIEGIDDGDFGFLTYRNNGTFVKKFNLSVPVTVQYGWGIISTEKPITVPVATTIKEGI